MYLSVWVFFFLHFFFFSYFVHRKDNICDFELKCENAIWGGLVSSMCVYVCSWDWALGGFVICISVHIKHNENGWDIMSQSGRGFELNTACSLSTDDTALEGTILYMHLMSHTDWIFPFFQMIVPWIFFFSSSRCGFLPRQSFASIENEFSARSCKTLCPIRISIAPTVHRSPRSTQPQSKRNTPKLYVCHLLGPHWPTSSLVEHLYLTNQHVKHYFQIFCVFFLLCLHFAVVIFRTSIHCTIAWSKMMKHQQLPWSAGSNRPQRYIAMPIMSLVMSWKIPIRIKLDKKIVRLVVVDFMNRRRFEE